VGVDPTTGKGLPTRWVNSILIDPTDASHVHVAFSCYRESDLAANVWETTDGANTWHNVSGNLPNAPVLGVKISGDDRTLFAATFGRSVWSIPIG
jgi:hypothetical protein